MQMRKPQPAKRHRLRRGVTTVEVALVAPVLLMLLFAAIDFSRANMIRNTMENAAFEAARCGALPGADEKKVKAAANDVLKILGIKQSVVTVTPSVITDTTDRVTVQIDVPLGSNLYASKQFLKKSTLRKSCTLTREQYAPAVQP